MTGKRSLVALSGVLLALACRSADTPGEVTGAIDVRNAAGRSGVYYLPAGPRSQPVPLLVILHGSGGSGEAILPAFRAAAQAQRFAIVAPDSRSSPSGQFTWQAGDQPGDVTPDLTHVLNCIEWVRTHTGIAIDPARVLIAGFSGGASSAPYIASNRPPFTHAAVLHGGVFPGGFGSRRMPVWLSTGEEDRYRPVPLVQQAADQLAGVGFTAVTFKRYPGGHDLSDAEVGDLLSWWLGAP